MEGGRDFAYVTQQIFSTWCYVGEPNSEECVSSEQLGLMFQRKPEQRVGTVQLELVADAGAMAFHCALMNMKFGGDRARRLARGHHAQNPPFGASQIAEARHRSLQILRPYPAHEQ